MSATNSYAIFKTLILLIFSPATCRITGPNNLTCYIGQDAVFKWSTVDNSTILSGTWGIEKSGNANPQYITVDVRDHKAYLNSRLNPELRKRLSFSGSLQKGQAWFTIRNVTVADRKLYIAIISEYKNSLLHYTTFLNVEERKKHTLESTTETLTLSSNVGSNKTVSQDGTGDNRLEDGATEGNTPGEDQNTSNATPITIAIAVIAFIVALVIFLVCIIWKKRDMLSKSIIERSPLNAKA